MPNLSDAQREKHKTENIKLYQKKISFKKIQHDLTHTCKFSFPQQRPYVRGQEMGDAGNRHNGVMMAGVPPSGHTVYLSTSAALFYNVV